MTFKYSWVSVLKCLARLDKCKVMLITVNYLGDFLNLTLNLLLLLSFFWLFDFYFVRIRMMRIYPIPQNNFFSLPAFTFLEGLNNVLKTKDYWYESIFKISLSLLKLFPKERELNKHVFSIPNFLKPEPSKNTKRNMLFFSAWGLFMKTAPVTSGPESFSSLCCLKNICLCRCFHLLSIMPNHRNDFLNSVLAS